MRGMLGQMDITSKLFDGLDRDHDGYLDIKVGG